MVPWFSCQTMITPWQLEGYRVHRLPVDHQFQLDADALGDALAACRSSLIAPILFSDRPSPLLTSRWSVLASYFP